MTRTHLPGILAMASIVVASNILVQFLYGQWLTWGAFTYPLGYWESLGYSTTNPQLTIHFDDQGLLHRARIDWD